MHKLKICSVICVGICILIVCASCSINQNSPMSLKNIEKTLEEMKSAELTLVFAVNPAQTYTVSIEDRLITMFGFDEWRSCSKIQHTSETLKMIYFDLSHSDDIHNSRIVIFSDGTAFVQVYDTEGFGNKKYYKFENEETYNNVISYIEECYQKVS